MLKYLNTEVVFREVPDEISLAINITNCPCRCDGCHSPQLWEDIGEPLNKESLLHLIDNNKGITCVLFMGGDSDLDTLFSLTKIVKKRKLKVAWYSGRWVYPKDLSSFDYIKLGQYLKSCGGLSDKNTNQKFYKVEKVMVKKGRPNLGYLYSLQDQTAIFQRN